MSISRNAVEAGKLYQHVSHKTGMSVRLVTAVYMHIPTRRMVADWVQVDPRSGRPTGKTGTTLVESFAVWAHDIHHVARSRA